MKERLYSNPRLLDKSRAAYRRLGKWDLDLPPLLPAAGKVEIKDAIRVILPTAAGIAIVVAVPVGGWRFELSTYDGFAVAQPTATATATVDQAKSDTDALLDLFVDLERRVVASELASNAAIKNKLVEVLIGLGALRAKHRPLNNNVVHFNNVAAE